MPSLPETRASLILRLPDAADARAWDDFIGVYAPLVYRLARRHGLQPADADDVVQDVLAAVARSVESWLARDPLTRLRRYLLDRGLLRENDIADLDAEGEQQAADLRTRMNLDVTPDPDDLFRYVYAEPTPALRSQQQDLARETATLGYKLEATEKEVARLSTEIATKAALLNKIEIGTHGWFVHMRLLDLPFADPPSALTDGVADHLHDPFVVRP